MATSFPFLFMAVLHGAIDTSAMIDCRALVDPEQRLSCYDQLADSLPAPSTTLDANVAPSDHRGKDSESNNSNVSSPRAQIANSLSKAEREDLFGRADGQSAKAIEEVLGIEFDDSLEGTLSQVDRTPHGKLMLTLDNQQVWSQVDNTRLTLRPGDKIRIERASFGSFTLEKLEGSRSIRVKRLD